MEFEEITDFSEACAVMHAAFERYRTDPIPSSALTETPQSLASEVINGVQMYGVRSQGVLVAFAKVTQCILNDGGVGAYISRVSVDPSRQGKGIGARLIEEIAHRGLSRGYGGLACTVRQSEPGNLAFYEKLGFRQVSRQVTVSRVGAEIPTVSLERNL